MLSATPLPPYPMRYDLEDGLIDSVVSETLPYLQCLDGIRLMDLYIRHRASPENLNGDEKALIYASLCLARYNQIRRGTSTGRESSREDLSYYGMAREALASLKQASVIGTCKSQCLTFADVRGSTLRRHVCTTQRKSRRVSRGHKSVGVAHQGGGTAQTKYRSDRSGSGSGRNASDFVLLRRDVSNQCYRHTRSNLQTPSNHDRFDTCYTLRRNRLEP